MEAAVFDRGGWYDYFTAGTFVEWKALAKAGKPAILVMGAGSHGSFFESGRQAPLYGDADILLSEISLFEHLRDGFRRDDVPTRVFYFLMGDAANPKAPGNTWMITDTWPPVPHEAVSFYLQPNGSLDAKPAGKSGRSLGFSYDPKNPVLTRGGNHSPSNLHGPVDQSRLRDRDDILFIETGKLKRPLPIVGPVACELYIQSDAPDTMFTAWLIDVYPDGYCWPIQEAATVLRFRHGMDDPTPLSPDEVVKLEFEFIDTAVVVDKGHKLGLWISSSAYPIYEVHPNTWDSISSYAVESRIAHQKVLCSEDYPSRIILPVPGEDALVEYDAARHDFRN